MRELGTPEARARVAEAVGAVEKKTCAEIVVVLRATSGSYRHVDLAFGAAAAFALLCVFLYHPAEFTYTWFALEQAAMFVLGSVACASLPPLRRALSSRGAKDRNVLTAARAAFVELGVGRTKSRTGVLVYLASFERTAEVVFDVGIDAKALGTDLEAITASLRGAVREGRVNDLVKALEALGDALSKPHPRTDGDVDELSNEVAA